MAMTDRRAWGILAALSVATVVAAASVRLETFWGDAATYHAMAWSLAEDRDLRYEARDILRVRREIPGGPQGLFLKRAYGGLTPDGVQGAPFFRRVRADEHRLYYAKPFLYPMAAAPLVAVIGSRGLYVTNALAFGAALLFGYLACRRERSPGQSLLLVLAIAFGTITPLYLVWLAPEMFYFGLAAVALAAWRLDRPLLACVLLGMATFAKPPNVFLSIPVLAAPLLTAGRPFGKRLLDGVGRWAVLTATTLLFFGWNVAFTGEWNFQSGERKTFYEAFPFEVRDGKEIRFGATGIWMTTPVAGPMAEGDDAPPPTARTEPPRPAWELKESFAWNLWYFWVGRFGGALAYFLPVVVAAVLFVAGALRHRAGLLACAGLAVAWSIAVVFLPASWYGGGRAVNFVLLACYQVPLIAAGFALSLWGPKQRDAALALCALLATYVFYLWLIADNWYGGSGTVGNRYFLTLAPLALFFAPIGREVVVAASGALAVAVFLWPLFVAPFYHSMRPGAHAATRASFRALPAELTMLNDLSIFGELWRKRKDYGDTGDDHKHWPAEPTAYRLYFPDDGTYGREAKDGALGFWLRGGHSAEVLLRAFDLKPIRRIRIAVTGGPQGDDVGLHVEGRREELRVAAGETKEAVFEASRGFPYKETFVYVLKLRSSRGAPDALGRSLGSFVQITLEVDGKR